ncbi:F0F1 ATP synthase subunit delta [Clostridium sp. 19966]|uniref:F0F1 ATP synthase subunit delta n=1 Tax=Clostridium sp. 19966 TaxID=2768166 RepID=UPI0028DF9CE2|nr:F0F1 ATP synthase subunit delta [Clostridium sp. 19966]MDT8715587.1 F0F1 ATP synthase subunit delta [Clostridium sp. 19966]
MYEFLDRRYALALYQAGEEKGKADLYLQQLRDVVELIDGNEDLLNLLKHPQVSNIRKKEIFGKLFKGKIEDEVYEFLIILINKDRIDNLKSKLNQMEKIHLEKNNTVIATVKTVVPLLQNEKDSLVEKLEKKYSKKIILNQEIDETILGGVFIKVGDDVIDGTLKSKLEEMKELMLKAEQR